MLQVTEKMTKKQAKAYFQKENYYQQNSEKMLEDKATGVALQELENVQETLESLDLTSMQKEKYLSEDTMIIQDVDVFLICDSQGNILHKEDI